MCEGLGGGKEKEYICTGHVCMRGSVRVRNRNMILQYMHV